MIIGCFVMVFRAKPSSGEVFHELSLHILCASCKKQTRSSTNACGKEVTVKLHATVSANREGVVSN